MGLSQSQQTLSRSSTLPYDHIPQRAQPQRGVRTKNCPSSPGSEMVTLEDFLKESNLQSPPMVLLLLLHFFIELSPLVAVVAIPEAWVCSSLCYVTLNTYNNIQIATRHMEISHLLSDHRTCRDVYNTIWRV